MRGVTNEGEAPRSKKENANHQVSIRQILARPLLSARSQIQAAKMTAAEAACPACRGRSRGYYSYPSVSYSRYSTDTGSGVRSSSSARSGGGSSSSVRPRWSQAGSTIAYAPIEVQALTPIRESVEALAARQDLRDMFLCHAWEDRLTAAKEKHDLLVTRGVSVWFSEKDVGLGVPLMRAIDKGLGNSRVGIVLVTPAFLRCLPREGIADKELSALLARERLVPIVHGTTFEALRDVSPLLGSRSGLSTAEDSMAIVAEKLAELVNVDLCAATI